MPRFGIILAMIATVFLTACTATDEAPPTVGASSVADQPIALDWKLAEGETIAYHTAMTPLDNPSFELNWDEFFMEDRGTMRQKMSIFKGGNSVCRDAKISNLSLIS